MPPGPAIERLDVTTLSVYTLQVQVLYTSLIKQQEEQTRVALLEQQVLAGVASKSDITH